MNNKPSSGNKKADKHEKGEKNTLLTDKINYRETLQTYLRYVQQLPPQRDWMKYKFGLRIRDILDEKKNIKVLGVGTGSGEVDIDFLNEIVRCGKERLGETGYNVLYQVIEPNSSNIDFFRNAVKDNPEYKQIQFRWYNGTFDKFCTDFRTRETEDNKFDFVHFVRVFYHIDSVKSFDRTYAHLLAKNGIMCAVGENEDAFWPRMMHFLADHKMEHECFTCSGPVSQNYFLPGWINQARERDWKYESYVHGYHFDITLMYDPSSKDGNQVMDFALHAKSARKTVKQSTIDDFFELLDANKIEKTVMENGVPSEKIYYPCELGAIMITKE